MQIDEFDRRILRTLQESPDLPVAEIAEQVGLSPTPCWRRIKRLEQAGIISGRAVLINSAAMGYEISVFAYIKLKQHDERTLEAFEEKILEHPEIVECFSMSGDIDYIIRILSKNIKDYEIIIKRVVLHLPGVQSINSSFALKCIKLTTKVPI